MARETKLYNNLKDWEWYDNPKMVCVYGFLLSHAASKRISWHGIVIERGQLVVSVQNIASCTKTSVQTVRTCLRHLLDSGEIQKRSTNQYTIISIINYEKYHKTEETSAETPEEVSKERQLPSEPLVAPTSDAQSSDEQLYQSEMLQDQSWQELMCMNFKMSKADILAKINVFFLDVACRVHKHDDVNDAKRHFNNWLLKTNDKLKQNDNGNTNQQQNNRRRGFEVTATSADDYKCSF